MTLADLRAAFPVLDDGLCFLDWGATGLLPESARRAIHGYVDELARCPGADATWMHAVHGETRQRVRQLVAGLIGAAPKDVALMESTTAGLHVAASAIALAPGDNVVVSELDYLAVAMPWKRRAEDAGIELRWVPPRDDAIHPDDVLERVDDRTRIVALSTICWTTGAVLDLDALAGPLRTRGVHFVVDGIQTFGTFPIDVRRTPVAFLAVGGHKWLASLLGAGFLYVDPSVAKAHRPGDQGFLCGRPTRGQWWEWFQDPLSSAQEDVVFPPFGRSFETGGTASYPGAIGLDASLSLFADTGVDVIANHVLDLGDALIAGLDDLGCDVLTPRDRRGRAGLIVFHVPGDADRQRDVAMRLRGDGVVVSVRYSGGRGGLRASLHGPNDASDVQRLLEALRALL